MVPPLTTSSLVAAVHRCLRKLSLFMVLWCGLVGVVGSEPSEAQGAGERNNWAVLVDTSRYWYNYRHAANVLSFYHTIKRLGIPDSQIIVMLADDMPCNSRNPKPGMVFNEMHHHLNLYGEDVEVDYRGDEVSVDNFIRLLTGRHPPNTPRNKRLLTDSTSNIFIFITGHSGEEFIKFQDWEEITSNDIADAFGQMQKQRRYKKILWVSDTCQAATLQNQFYSTEIMAMGSSGKKENSYSHHVDHELGVAIIDRFTYYSLDFLNRMTATSRETVHNFHRWFNPKQLNSNPELRSDLFSTTPQETLLTDFLASTGRMRFQSDVLTLSGSSGSCSPLSSGAPFATEILDSGGARRGPSGFVSPGAAAAASSKGGLWTYLAAASELLGYTPKPQREAATFAGTGGGSSDPGALPNPGAALWMAGFGAVLFAAGASL